MCLTPSSQDAFFEPSAAERTCWKDSLRRPNGPARKRDSDFSASAKSASVKGSPSSELAGGSPRLSTSTVSSAGEANLPDTLCTDVRRCRRLSPEGYLGYGPLFNPGWAGVAVEERLVGVGTDKGTADTGVDRAGRGSQEP